MDLLNGRSLYTKHFSTSNERLWERYLSTDSIVLEYCQNKTLTLSDEEKIELFNILDDLLSHSIEDLTANCLIGPIIAIIFLYNGFISNFQIPLKNKARKHALDKKAVSILWEFLHHYGNGGFQFLSDLGLSGNQESLSEQLHWLFSKSYLSHTERREIRDWYVELPIKEQPVFGTNDLIAQSIFGVPIQLEEQDKKWLEKDKHWIFYSYREINEGNEIESFQLNQMASDDPSAFFVYCFLPAMSAENLPNLFGQILKTIIIQKTDIPEISLQYSSQKASELRLPIPFIEERAFACFKESLKIFKESDTDTRPSFHGGVLKDIFAGLAKLAYFNSGKYFPSEWLVYAYEHLRSQHILSQWRTYPEIMTSTVVQKLKQEIDTRSRHGDTNHQRLLQEVLFKGIMQGTDEIKQTFKQLVLAKNDPMRATEYKELSENETPELRTIKWEKGYWHLNLKPGERFLFTKNAVLTHDSGTEQPILVQVVPAPRDLSPNILNMLDSAYTDDELWERYLKPKATLKNSFQVAGRIIQVDTEKVTVDIGLHRQQPTLPIEQLVFDAPYQDDLARLIGKIIEFKIYVEVEQQTIQRLSRLDCLNITMPIGHSLELVTQLVEVHNESLVFKPIVQNESEVEIPEILIEDRQRISLNPQLDLSILEEWKGEIFTLVIDEDRKWSLVEKTQLLSIYDLPAYNHNQSMLLICRNPETFDFEVLPGFTVRLLLSKWQYDSQNASEIIEKFQKGSTYELSWQLAKNIPKFSLEEPVQQQKGKKEATEKKESASSVQEYLLRQDQTFTVEVSLDDGLVYKSDEAWYTPEIHQLHFTEQHQDFLRRWLDIEKKSKTIRLRAKKEVLNSETRIECDLVLTSILKEGNVYPVSIDGTSDNSVLGTLLEQPIEIKAIDLSFVPEPINNLERFKNYLTQQGGHVVIPAQLIQKNPLQFSLRGTKLVKEGQKAGQFWLCYYLSKEEAVFETEDFQFYRYLISKGSCGIQAGFLVQISELLDSKCFKVVPKGKNVFFELKNAQTPITVAFDKKRKSAIAADSAIQGLPVIVWRYEKLVERNVSLTFVIQNWQFDYSSGDFTVWLKPQGNTGLLQPGEVVTGIAEWNYKSNCYDVIVKDENQVFQLESHWLCYSPNRHQVLQRQITEKRFDYWIVDKHYVTLKWKSGICDEPPFLFEEFEDKNTSQDIRDLKYQKWLKGNIELTIADKNEERLVFETSLDEDRYITLYYRELHFQSNNDIEKLEVGDTLTVSVNADEQQVIVHRINPSPINQLLSRKGTQDAHIDPKFAPKFGKPYYFVGGFDKPPRKIPLIVEGKHKNRPTIAVIIHERERQPEIEKGRLHATLLNSEEVLENLGSSYSQLPLRVLSYSLYSLRLEIINTSKTCFVSLPFISPRWSSHDFHQIQKGQKFLGYVRKDKKGKLQAARHLPERQLDSSFNVADLPANDDGTLRMVLLKKTDTETYFVFEVMETQGFPIGDMVRLHKNSFSSLAAFQHLKPGTRCHFSFRNRKRELNLIGMAPPLESQLSVGDIVHCTISKYGHSNVISLPYWEGVYCKFNAPLTNSTHACIVEIDKKNNRIILGSLNLDNPDGEHTIVRISRDRKRTKEQGEFFDCSEQGLVVVTEVGENPFSFGIRSEKLDYYGAEIYLPKYLRLKKEPESWVTDTQGIPLREVYRNIIDNTQGPVEILFVFYAKTHDDYYKFEVFTRNKKTKSINPLFHYVRIHFSRILRNIEDEEVSLLPWEHWLIGTTFVAQIVEPKQYDGFDEPCVRLMYPIANQSLLSPKDILETNMLKASEISDWSPLVDNKVSGILPYDENTLVPVTPNGKIALSQLHKLEPNSFYLSAIDIQQNQAIILNLEGLRFSLGSQRFLSGVVGKEGVAVFNRYLFRQKAANSFPVFLTKEIVENHTVLRPIWRDNLDKFTHFENQALEVKLLELTPDCTLFETSNGGLGCVATDELFLNSVQTEYLRFFRNWKVRLNMRKSEDGVYCFYNEFSKKQLFSADSSQTKPRYSVQNLNKGKNLPENFLLVNGSHFLVTARYKSEKYIEIEGFDSSSGYITSFKFSGLDSSYKLLESSHDVAVFCALTKSESEISEEKLLKQYDNLWQHFATPTFPDTYAVDEKEPHKIVDDKDVDDKEPHKMSATFVDFMGAYLAYRIVSITQRHPEKVRSDLLQHLPSDKKTLVEWPLDKMLEIFWLIKRFKAKDDLSPLLKEIHHLATECPENRITDILLAAVYQDKRCERPVLSMRYLKRWCEWALTSPGLHDPFFLFYDPCFSKTEIRKLTDVMDKKGNEKAMEKIINPYKDCLSDGVPEIFDDDKNKNKFITRYSKFQNGLKKLRTNECLNAAKCFKDLSGIDQLDNTNKKNDNTLNAIKTLSRLLLCTLPKEVTGKQKFQIDHDILGACRTYQDYAKI